jgi:hypothetical protein
MGAALGFVALRLLASGGGGGAVALSILIALGGVLGRRGRFPPLALAWLGVGGALLLGFAFGRGG